MLADRLRDLRASRGLTQRELAQMAGLRQSTVARLEVSGAQPRGQTVRRLAVALRTTAGYLLGQTDDAQPVGLYDLVDCITDLAQNDRLLLLALCQRLRTVPVGSS